MMPEVQNWKVLGICLVFSTFTDSLRGTGDLEVNPTSLELHSIAVKCLQRGQLLIELFPPLSYSLGLYDESFQLQISLAAILLGYVSLVYSRRRALATNKRNLLPILLSLVPIVRYLGGDEDHHTLLMSVVLGDMILWLALLFALLPASHTKTTSGIVNALQLPLALIGLMLNFEFRTFTFVSITVIVQQIGTMWKQLDDRSLSVTRLLCRFTFHTLWSFCMGVVLVICVFTTIFPRSETSAGGNFNLHYLPHIRRRELRQGFSLATTVENPPGPRSTASPEYSIPPGSPISMYIPRAGFLSQDDLQWDELSRVFAPNLTNEEEMTQEYRVIFKDSIRNTDPWVLDQAMPYGYNPSDAAITDYIWSGEFVRVRSASSRRVLTAREEKTSIVDRTLFFPEGIDEVFYRRDVSTTSNTTNQASIWKIEYKPAFDRGFRLLNVQYKCYLGTSFRSFPNWNNIYQNDTFLSMLDLELEATCTYNSRAEASTFFVIDGFRSKHPTNDAWNTMKIAWRQSAGFTIDIVKAMYNLYTFRRKWGALQDVPKHLTTPRVRVGWSVNTCIFRLLSLVSGS